MIRISKSKEDNVLYFSKEIYKRILEENLIEINGKKLNQKIIKDIFSYEGAYNYTLKVFKGELERYNISCEEYIKGYKDIHLSRVELLLLMRKIVELDAKNPNIKSYEKLTTKDIKEFEEYCLYEKMLEKYKDKTKKYDIEGNKYEIKFADMWKFYNCSEDEYHRLLKSDTIYGIKKEHFLYACIKFFDYYIVDY